MNKKLFILATHNKGKVREFGGILAEKNIDLVCLSDLGIMDECEEPYDTLEFNALGKLNFYFEKIKDKKFDGYDEIMVLAEDSGLFVPALPNVLGVQSKRFSESGTDDDNNILLLEMMDGKEDRSAYYTTSVAMRFLDDSKCTILTYGTIHGTIAETLYEEGFAYDKLFITNYNGTDVYLGELTLEQKNEISSRRKALESLM